MSNDKKLRKCRKCGYETKSAYYYEQHINREIPCDYKCITCGFQLTKHTYTKHFDFCGLKSKEIQEINNNVTAPQNTVSVDNSNNNNQSNNNTLLMNPFGLEHFYMDKEKELGEHKGIISKMIQEYEFGKAYEYLHTLNHANPKKPENHNHFMPSLNRKEVLVFKGKRFVLEPLSEFMPKSFEHLRKEMDWMVLTNPDLTPEQRSQMRWDIKANWMLVNAQEDETMMRCFRNNKDVVLETFDKYDVYPNAELMAKLYGWKIEEVKHRNKLIKLDYEDTNE